MPTTPTELPPKRCARCASSSALPQTAACGGSRSRFRSRTSPDTQSWRAASETPIATGEIHQTRWDFARLIHDRAADILQPDVGVVGGVSEYLRIAHAAETFDLPLAPHWHANLHAHLADAIPGTSTIEYFELADDIYNFETLVTERVSPAGP